MRKILFMLALISSTVSVFGQKKSDFQAKGDVAFANHDFQNAIDYYTKAIDSTKIDKSIRGVVYFYRGESYKGLNQYQNALKDYSEAIKINPIYREAYWGRAIMYALSANFGASINDYHKAISLTDHSDSENLSILYTNLALDENAIRQTDAALKDDSTAILLNPAFARAYNLRGEIFASIQKYPDAITYFNRAIDNYKDNDNKTLSFWVTELADAKNDNQEYKDAINNYSMALKIYPDNGVAYWNRAAAYHRHKDYELAAADYSSAMSYYKGDNISLSKLYDDRASNEVGQSQLDAAIKDDSTAIALNKDNSSAYLNIADAYTQNGDYQKGIDKYREVLKSDKNNRKFASFIYYLIANNEYFLKEFDKVVADCSTAISLDPADPSPYFNRGKVYYKQMNKKDLAMSDFNKVIALDTSKKSIDYVFALFYVNRGDEAAKILQDDVVSTNDNVQILGDYYNLACLYSLMNKPDDANSYLKMAIDKGYAKKYAAADEDLDNIRNTTDYKNIIGSGK